jgi:molecular chaperone GrpE
MQEWHGTFYKLIHTIMSDQTQNPPSNKVEDTLENTETTSEIQTTDITDEVKQLRESLARSQADYQNLVMRNERDKIEMVSFLSAKLVTPLLKEVDNLERAVKLKEGVEGDGFVDGVRSVLASMEKYLEAQGVKSFTSIGEEVDPAKHDVMTQAPGAEGKIVSEFEKGYMMGTRVLRHAKVVVGSWE